GRIHRDRMRDVQIARARSLLAPRLDELPALVELDDAGVRVAAVPVGDEDIAVRRGHDRGGCVEFVLPAAGLAGLAEREQQLALGRKLEHLMALAPEAEAVGHPDIAVAVDMQAVRK